MKNPEIIARHVASELTALKSKVRVPHDATRASRDPQIAATFYAQHKGNARNAAWALLQSVLNPSVLPADYIDSSIA